MSELGSKRYHSITEVANYFNVNTSLIRFWEKEFDALNPKKGSSGNRLFSQEDIELLKLIYHLVKERGFTLKGAKAKMKGNREDLAQNMEVIERLNNIKKALLEIKSQLGD